MKKLSLLIILAVSYSNLFAFDKDAIYKASPEKVEQLSLKLLKQDFELANSVVRYFGREKDKNFVEHRNLAYSYIGANYSEIDAMLTCRNTIWMRIYRINKIFRFVEPKASKAIESLIKSNPQDWLILTALYTETKMNEKTTDKDKAARYTRYNEEVAAVLKQLN